MLSSPYLTKCKSQSPQICKVEGTIVILKDVQELAESCLKSLTASEWASGDEVEQFTRGRKTSGEIDGVHLEVDCKESHVVFRDMVCRCVKARASQLLSRYYLFMVSCERLEQGFGCSVAKHMSLE